MGLEQGTYAWVMGLMYEMPAEGMLRAVGANIIGMRMVPEVLTACECVVVLILITDAVMAPVVMCSVVDMLDMEVWASAGCGTVLMDECLALLKKNLTCVVGPQISNKVPIVHFCSVLTHIQKYMSME